ncbi:MAG: ATP-binding protein [Oscillospiraceae bacterium]|nr:ATP-binding protein [Oscillospiraceae bacterium]
MNVKLRILISMLALAVICLLAGIINVPLIIKLFIAASASFLIIADAEHHAKRMINEIIEADKMKDALNQSENILNELNETCDITEMKNVTEAFDKQVERQTLMTYISQSFLSGEDLDSLITNVLRMTGKFMRVAQILLYKKTNDNYEFTCVNEWKDQRHDLPTRVGGVFNIPLTLFNAFKELNGRENFFISSNEPDMQALLKSYRVNFQNFLTTTIYCEGLPYAVLDYSREDDGSRWSRDEINMAAFVSDVLTGVFQRKIMEEQLIKAKELAEQGNRSKSIFLANMSHEIRTPMNAILGIAEIKLSETLSEDTEKAFTKIYDAGSLLINIINNILDFSKIEAGKLECIPVRYDVPDLINGAVQLNRLRYDGKPIDFAIEIDENTPQELIGDELLIKQVLNNLLSNAFKYTEKGEVKLSVGIAPESGLNDAATLVFHVSDTGQGMSRSQIDVLFDEYTRFNLDVNRTIEGVGLGMSITKHLVNKMGGEILVKSEQGKGSLFTVRLPQKRSGKEVCGAGLAKKIKDFDFHTATRQQKLQMQHQKMPQGRALVVDDVESNLYVAVGMLKPYGLQVETVMSGLEAIEKIGSGEEYDVLFMDHMMPVMDGMEATQKLREMGYSRPIVALTANAVKGQAEMFLQNGFDGFISKPIDSRELNALIKGLLREQKPGEEGGAPGSQTDDDNELSELDLSYDEEIIGFFISDSENTVKTLEELLAKPSPLDEADIQLYVVTVHGMKSVLSYVGEKELSAFALKLELIGKERDHAAIASQTPKFLIALKSVVAGLRDR